MRFEPEQRVNVLPATLRPLRDAADSNAHDELRNAWYALKNSGVGSLEEVRADSVLRDIPVVAQSTDVSRDDIRRGLAAGASGYVAKPVSREHLYGLLDALLR